MLQIAKLTDQREGVDADVVAAEIRATAADRALMAVRARMRDRAVAAYVRGRTLPTQARAAPAVYLAVAAAKESELQDGYRAIRDDALDIFREYFAIVMQDSVVTPEGTVKVWLSEESSLVGEDEPAWPA